MIIFVNFSERRWPFRAGTESTQRRSELYREGIPCVPDPLPLGAVRGPERSPAEQGERHRETPSSGSGFERHFLKWSLWD